MQADVDGPPGLTRRKLHLLGALVLVVPLHIELAGETLTALVSGVRFEPIQPLKGPGKTVIAVRPDDRSFRCAARVLPIDGARLS